MVVLKNNLDGGTNGVGLTTGNTGGDSGDAFTAVEATATFSNEQAHSGSLSMKSPSSSSSGFGRWAVGERNIAARLYVYITETLAADYVFVHGRVTTVDGIFSVMFDGLSRLRLRRNSDGVNIWTADGPFPEGEWVRVELLVEQGVTNDDGRIRVAYYLGESLTPVQDSGWLTGQDLRGDEGAVGQFYVGKVSTSLQNGSVYLDTIEVHAGADYDGFIGPIAVTAGSFATSYSFGPSTVTGSAPVIPVPEGGVSTGYGFAASSGGMAPVIPTPEGGTATTYGFTTGSAGSRASTGGVETGFLYGPVTASGEAPVVPGAGGGFSAAYGFTVAAGGSARAAGGTATGYTFGPAVTAGVAPDVPAAGGGFTTGYTFTVTSAGETKPKGATGTGYGFGPATMTAGEDPVIPDRRTLTITIPPRGLIVYSPERFLTIGAP